LLSFLSVAALAGCAVDPTDESVFEDEREEVASSAEAIHEATCLDVSDDGIPNYDAYTYAYYPGSCGGSAGVTLSAGNTTYGVSTCPDQFRARFGINSGWHAARAQLEWHPSAPVLDTEFKCGVALLRGSYWVQRISDGAWVRLGDTEHVGRWTGSYCASDTPVSGFANFPVIDPDVYSSVHVAANAAYFFVKQPVRVSLPLTPPSCG